MICVAEIRVHKKEILAILSCSWSTVVNFYYLSPIFCLFFLFHFDRAISLEFLQFCKEHYSISVWWMQFFIKISRFYRRPVHYQSIQFGRLWIHHPFWLDTITVYYHQTTFPNWIVTAPITIIRKFSKPLTEQSNHPQMFTTTNSMDIITMEGFWSNILWPKKMSMISMLWTAFWADLCHLFRHRATVFLHLNYQIWDSLRQPLNQQHPRILPILPILQIHKHIQ